MRGLALTLFVLLAQGPLSFGELRASDAIPASSPAQQSLSEQDYATGDWGGVRRSLADRGVIFNLTYAADPIGVVSGGIKRGIFYNGLLDLGTDIDLEKLVGWKGGHFHVNALYPHGEDGSANYVGDIGTFSNIQAYDTWRLYELWLEQEFFDGRFSLRAGQITFDSEFAVLDAYGGLFVQSGFGAPEAFSANLPLPVFPNATAGIRVRFSPVKGLAIQGAVFDGNVAPGLTPDHSPNAARSTEFNRHGTDWSLRPDEGALVAAEISYRFNQVTDEEASATRTTADSAQRVAGERSLPERGLAGSYETGILYHSDDFADIYDVTLLELHSSLAPARARNRGADYSIYVNIEQEIWREPGTGKQGLGVFGHAAWMPGDRNRVAFSFEGGLHYVGAVPGRGNDALGLGVAYLAISDRVAAAVRESNRRDPAAHLPPDYEATIELVYRCQIAPWFSIQPHLQYVLHPGGTTERDNAFIVGVRTNIAF
ncbi:MAG: porin [Verrucomicrobiota bacterium]|jgi:porin